MADSPNSSTISPQIEVFRAFRFQWIRGEARGVAFLNGKATMSTMSLIVLCAPEAKML
jgi:hypothetical protein